MLADRAADFRDRRHRLIGRRLHLADLLADFLGRLRGLRGERLDLGGDDGKSPSRLAGPRRFDGGVQRQQIGLLGHRADHLDHFADPAGGLGRSAIRALVCSTWLTASRDILCKSCTWRLISDTDEAISSAAAAADCALAEDCSEAEADGCRQHLGHFGGLGQSSRR